ncbi:hypothetical protein NZK33_20740 [Cyanobium sp. FGCU-6]|nr:hypothetical protein [Cyanobium sp. FGCU6]
MLRGFPDAKPVVLAWIPAVIELLAAQQLSLAGCSPEDARPDDAIDGDVASHGQAFRIAMGTFAIAEALEEGESKARICIEGAFILGEILIKGGVDFDQGLAHAHGGVVGVEHRLGLAEDRLAGTNEESDCIQWRDTGASWLYGGAIQGLCQKWLERKCASCCRLH